MLSGVWIAVYLRVGNVKPFQAAFFLRGDFVEEVLKLLFRVTFFFFPPPRMEWRKTAWGAGNGEGELCGGNDEGGAGHQELTDHSQPWEFCSKL